MANGQTMFPSLGLAQSDKKLSERLGLSTDFLKDVIEQSKAQDKKVGSLVEGITATSGTPHHRAGQAVGGALGTAIFGKSKELTKAEGFKQLTYSR
mgnify:CR=1 FL=1